MLVEVNTIDTKLKIQEEVLIYAQKLTEQGILFDLKMSLKKDTSYDGSYSVMFWVDINDFNSIFKGKKVIKTEFGFMSLEEKINSLNIRIACFVDHKIENEEVTL